jgi:enoyl-CoA hydratase/carnithine racemase
MTAAPASPLVTASRVGAVAVVTLDRSERRNALSRELADQLTDRLAEVVADGARAIVLAAAGPVFSAGGDLEDLMSVVAEGTEATSAAVYRHFHGLVRALRSCPVPIVAAVSGPALGAGFDLMLHCPMRVMSTTARLASTWISLGLATGMGAAHELALAVGTARACELVLTGRAVDADEALRIGLVNRVVPPEQVYQAALDLAEQVSAKNPAAVRAGLDVISSAHVRTLDEQLDILREVQGGLLTGAEFRVAAERILNRTSTASSGTAASP